MDFLATWEIVDRGAGPRHTVLLAAGGRGGLGIDAPHRSKVAAPKAASTWLGSPALLTASQLCGEGGPCGVDS